CHESEDGEIRAIASGGVPGMTGYQYDWSNNDTGPLTNRLAAGTYTLTTTDANNCMTVNSFDVGQPDPVIVNVETEPATDGCNGTATAMVSGGTPPYSYDWSVGAKPTDMQVTGLCPGDISVIVFDANGCTPQPEETEALVKDRRFPCAESRLVMSPNGDGLNDFFFINCNEDFTENSLEIYDRWGELVFNTVNYDNTWDGVNNAGEALPTGAYYYVFEYIDGSGNLVQAKGSITLLREE
ncbi:MAG: gliding motility-associated C-terminal domain-containing protein, partial [Saprospiraceae bacterium]|nr:gliding motility-associated C-terminal domain-containing protein [Saprospiraceae bacterium]